MKKKLRDLLVLLISMSGITYVYRWRVRKCGPLVRVLCLHDVPDKEWFESILMMLQKNYNLITPAQFHEKDFSEKKINVLLTFDDGYQSWVDICLPVMSRYNVKGIFFITSGLLDAVDSSKNAASKFVQQRLRLTTKRTVLTWGGAQKLAAAGHTVGGHTYTHPSLATLKSDQIQQEVLEDRKRLEQMLDIQLSDFAYPFGTKQDYSKMTIQKVSEAGYTNQYSAVSHFFMCASTEIIPRTLIENKQTHLSICRWVEGGYDVFRFFYDE